MVYVRGEGTDECPSEVALRLSVLARLGYDPFSPQASPVVIARVDAVEQGFLGTVELIDREGRSSGRRDLKANGERCGELLRAMALSISLAIDPERAERPKRPEPSVAARPAQARPRSSEAKRPGISRSRQNQPPGAFTGLAVVGGLGVVPGVALGALALVGVRWPTASLALEGRVLRSLGVAVEPRGVVGGMLVSPGVTGCVRREPLGLCLVGLFGLQRLQASEISDPGASSGLYAGLGPRVELAAPLGPSFSLSLRLEVMVNLVRNSARLGPREVWLAPPANGAFLFGVNSHFL